MKKVQTGLTLALLLIATTIVAKDKTALCHVGSNEGPNNQTYDPSCVPNDTNSYFCPDAGKVDLIAVGNADAHLNNPAHEWGGLSDYLQSEIVPFGNAGEDIDRDYIDDGCDPAYDPPGCKCFADIPYLAPYQNDGLSYGPLPCGQNPSAAREGVIDRFTFYENGQATYTVGVDKTTYCDGSILYDCVGGPAGYFTLSAQEYGTCLSGPSWSSNPPN